MTNPAHDGIDYVLVKGLVDLPAPVGDDITFDWKTYDFHFFSLDNPFICPYNLKLPKALTPKLFQSLGGVISFTKENGTFLSSADIGLGVVNITSIVSGYGATGTSKGIDLLNPTGGGTLQILNTGVLGFASLGYSSVKDTTITNSGLKDFKTGLILENVNKANIQGNNVEGTNQATTFFDFQGTMESIVFNNNTSKPLSNESILNLDPTLVIGSGQFVGNANLLDGGKVFATGSLDESDPRLTFGSNGTLDNSTARTNMNLPSNIELTTVSTGVPTSINATWLDSFERSTLEHRLDFDTETGNFTVGQVVTGGTSTAFGTITEIVDNGTDGYLIIKDVTGQFITSEIITDPITGSATLVKTIGYMKYTGRETITALIMGKITCQPDSIPQIAVRVSFALDTGSGFTIIDGGYIGNKKIAGSADAEEDVACFTHVTLNTDDKLTLYVENASSAISLKVLSGNFLMSKI